jgi:hypothetical protein
MDRLGETVEDGARVFVRRSQYPTTSFYTRSQEWEGGAH